MKLKWKPNWKEMKRWKKVALIALGLFLLFQIPFIYRRVRLGNLSSAIRRVNAERAALFPGLSRPG